MPWASEYDFTQHLVSGAYDTTFTFRGLSGGIVCLSGAIIAPIGSGNQPTLTFSSGAGFFHTNNAIGVSVASVWALQLSVFGPGLLVAPDRGLYILPQRQTNGSGDLMTVKGGDGLGGNNAGADVRLIPGDGAGTGANGVTAFRNVADTANVGTVNNSGYATFNGEVATLTNRGFVQNSGTTSAGTNLGTLTNAPNSGAPAFWLKVKINGVNYAIPCWSG